VALIVADLLAVVVAVPLLDVVVTLLAKMIAAIVTMIVVPAVLMTGKNIASFVFSCGHLTDIFTSMDQDDVKEERENGTNGDDRKGDPTILPLR